MNSIVSVHYMDDLAADELSMHLVDIVSQYPSKKLVVACIGTDRSTGDTLGPLVGMMLTDLNLPNVVVFGTLEEPLHAANLQSTLPFVEATAKELGAPVLAVDASLGNQEDVGMIRLRKGPIWPGSGLGKDLPKIGDYHIAGVVNFGGFMEYSVLRSTRLWLVMQMASVIAQGISQAMRYLYDPDLTFVAEELTIL